jgi:D-lactate dehydrogenase (cytochrome)
MASMQPERVDAAIRDLRALMGEQLSTAAAVREQHGHDEGHLPGALPDAVVFPASTAEVVQIVRACARRRVPMMAFGTGTGMEGNVCALNGGVCLDLSRMNRIVQVNEEDLDVVVEPGVTRKQLNEHLRDTGLFFPIDPGADASLGGMAATRASGTNAVRYGTMRDNVLALTVVLADGRVIRTAQRARKSSAGYDLTRLFVGSEGTLGIITELTLRLYGLPEGISSAVCTFPTVADAVNTVIQTIQMGIPVARIELLDELQVDAVNRYSNLNLVVAPTLLLEFHGTERGVQEQAESLGEIASEFGGSDFRWSSRAEERNRLWQARHDVAYAAKALKPGGEIWPTDVCVPISRLAECVTVTQIDIRESELVAPIVGHVGDGNFHVVMVVDPADSEEVKRATDLNERLISRALAMGGTCTGEHGIGYGKLDFLIAEHGEAVSVMRQIKQCLDPDNLMNPGKVVRV